MIKILITGLATTKKKKKMIKIKKINRSTLNKYIIYRDILKEGV